MCQTPPHTVKIHRVMVYPCFLNKKTYQQVISLNSGSSELVQVSGFMYIHSHRVRPNAIMFYGICGILLSWKLKCLRYQTHKLFKGFCFICHCKWPCIVARCQTALNCTGSDDIKKWCCVSTHNWEHVLSHIPGLTFFFLQSNLIEHNFNCEPILLFHSGISGSWATVCLC